MSDTNTREEITQNGTIDVNASSSSDFSLNITCDNCVSSADVMTKQIKLNDFSTSNPSLWFLSTEVIFSSNGIDTEKDMFNYLLQSLTIEQQEKIRKVIEEFQTIVEGQPKEKTPYTAAKTLLLTTYDDSEEKRLRKLFEETDVVNDKTPSEILTLIQKRAGTAVAEKAIKELWYSKIPTEVKPYLTSCKDWSLSQLAEQADTVHQLLRRIATTSSTPNATVCAINKNQSIHELPSSSCEKDMLMVKALQSLEKQIAALQFDRSRSRTRSPSSERSRHRTPERCECRCSSQNRGSPYRRNNSSRDRSKSRKRDVRHELCWYHYNYDEKAKKCMPGCKFFKQAGNDVMELSPR